MFVYVFTFNISYYAVASCVSLSHKKQQFTPAIPWKEINFRMKNPAFILMHLWQELVKPVKVTDSWNDKLG